MILLLALRLDLQFQAAADNFASGPHGSRTLLQDKFKADQHSVRRFGVAIVNFKTRFLTESLHAELHDLPHLGDRSAGFFDQVEGCLCIAHPLPLDLGHVPGVEFGQGRPGFLQTAG